MTLVVAEIHDDGVSFVADTKITWTGEDRRNIRLYEAAQAKLIILRADLCVGVSGHDPHGQLERLLDLRDAHVEQVLDVLIGPSEAGFVVASLEPDPRLWSIGDGVVEERTNIRRAWTGDPEANELFRQRYAEWPTEIEVEFKLLSSMQWLMSFGPVASVGGFHTRVATTPSGFRFVADQSFVMFPYGIYDFDVVTQMLRISPRPGTDPHGFTMLCAVGTGATPGALAYLIPQARLGLVSTHEAPHRALPLTVGTWRH